MISGAPSLSAAWSALGSAVLHFLWQGMLVGLLAATVLGCMHRRSSTERYAVACGALLCCFLAFVATFALALGDLSPVVDAGALPAPLRATGSTAGMPAPASAAGIAAWCWAVGALFMSARFALQGWGVHRLKTSAVSEVDARWQRVFRALREELGVSRGVRLLQSGLAEVPMVAGWLGPIVLIPASAFTGLPPGQLRALLAHELAHVRRWDHLLNAAQAVAETVLFFHPLVWWISKQVRLEREYCCDDSSVRVTGDPRVLAEALASMETLRLQHPMTRTVLAANGGPLMQRIARILGARPEGRSPLAGWQLAAGFVLSGVLAAAGSAYATPARVADADAVALALAQDDMRPEARAVWSKLEAAVKAGELTGAEAKKKFAAWRKVQAEKRAVAQDDATPEAKRVLARLKAAVEGGKITEEQAKERFAAWQARQKQQKSDAVDARKVWGELQAAVKAGKITEEQAREKMEALRRRMAKGRDLQEDADPAAVVKRIQAAVDAGDLTPEQGKARLEGYKKRVGEGQPARDVDPEALAKRLKIAVETGRLTPEQAQARMADLKKQRAEKKAAEKREAKGMIQRIQAAIDSGRITPKQGQERIEALKKRFAGEAPKKRKKAPDIW